MSLLLLPLALAHQPWIAADGQYATADAAFAIEEIDLSLVVYDQLSCDYPALWLAFDAADGEELFVQLGMPLLDRQADWRPSMAVLAPGLPPAPADFPFEVPDGLGVQLYDTEAVTDLELFVEPFTGTSSWILTQDTLPLPAGQGWVVAWDPAALTGKVWLATGTREEFDADTIARVSELVDDLRAFHELDGTPEGELVECAAPAAPDAEEPAQDAESGGCSTSPHAPGGLGLLAGATLLAARRRR